MKASMGRLEALEAKNADRLFVLLLVVLTAINLLCIVTTPLDLAPDEAHYWEWSKRLGLSYYSKGPLIAYLIRGCTLLFGDVAWGIRVGAVACTALTSIFFYLVVRKIYSAGTAFIAVLMLRLTLMSAYFGIAITTDPPVMLFWSLFTYTAILALFAPAYWIAAFVFLGLAVLTKYTALILYPSLILFLLFNKEQRTIFFKKQFVLGHLVFLLLLLPVLIWNSEHQWVNFAHNASHIVRSKGVHLQPFYVLDLLGGQAGLVGPLLFAAIIFGLIVAVRRFQVLKAEEQFLLFTSIPLLVVCLCLSLTKQVYANWPLPAYFGGLAILAGVVKGRIRNKIFTRWICYGTAVNIALILLAHFVYFGFTAGLPIRILPVRKLMGWREFGREVAQERERSPSPFLLTENYDVASELALYAQASGDVFCALITPETRRMNQYDIWGGWEKLAGRDAILVLRHSESANSLKAHFASLDNMGTRKRVFRGNELETFYLFYGKGYDGYSPPWPEKR